MLSEYNKSSIFFDNSSEHIEEVEDCRNILCVKIPAIDGLPEKTSFMDLSNIDFVDHLGDASTNMINFLIWVNNGESDRFDVSSGITKEHAKIFYKWLDESRYRSERWAIFDFDRTITKIEGFASLRGGMRMLNRYYKEYAKTQGAVAEPISPQEYMTYLCGKSRLGLLENMFESCKNNGVNIVVLTNNGACITDPTLIIEFMSVFGVTDFELICSRSYGSDKGRALHEELMDACPSLF